MFENSPLYYIMLSLIFLIIFGTISVATWMVWVTAVPLFIKLALTALGSLMAALCVIIYIFSAE